MYNGEYLSEEQVEQVIQAIKNGEKVPVEVLRKKEKATGGDFVKYTHSSGIDVGVAIHPHAGIVHVAHYELSKSDDVEYGVLVQSTNVHLPEATFDALLTSIEKAKSLQKGEGSKDNV